MRENEHKGHYDTGADFWHDTASRYGLEEASVICGNYLSVQLRTDSDEEKRFCRELFAAMYEATAGRADPAKLVYPYDFQRASDLLESSHYHESAERNGACARAIDEAINASHYAPNFYNLEIAAMKAVHDFGFERVNLVLAHDFQHRERDGRFSTANKEWAREIPLAREAFAGASLNAHPILIDGFTNHARKLYNDLGAERFALPGREESGHSVQGYEITRSIAFDNRRGFALGHNPAAPAPFVCWQFTEEKGKRDFYWGRYCAEETAARDSFLARVCVYMRDEGVKEIVSPIAAVEMSTEQNYNQIDGLRNNTAYPKADLTDGQTHEEIAELAPGTLPDAKASVMERIREAREAPQPPAKPRPEREKKAPGLER